MILPIKKRWVWFFAAAALVAIPQSAVVPAASPEADQAAKLIAARELGPTPMLGDLEELCDRIGGRPTGSPACDRAVDWAVAKFRAAGIDSVKAESYTIPKLWLGGKAEAKCLSPAEFPIRLAAAPFSASTPGGKALEAPLVDAGNGTAEDFAALGEKARGAIVLVHSEVMKTGDDLFAEYLRNGPLVEAAEEAGAAAILLQSTRPRGLLYRHPISMMPLDMQIVPIPAAIVSRENAGRLARLAAHGDVRISLALDNKIGGAYQARNVVAEISGSEKPDEFVVIGAHLDSWDLGTGADDNGVNAAMVLDLARGMKELGLVPRRTIRFVLFTGEEQGMLGSAAYVREHESEMDNTIAMITFDTGSGRTTGFDLDGLPQIRKAVEEALRPVEGFAQLPLLDAAADGTDNFDFLLDGVPNLVAEQDWEPYLPNYHAESDTFDVVDQRNAKLNAAIGGVLVWGLANRPNRLVPRQTRQQVKDLLRKTELDNVMKGFGQWEDWEAGRRGLKK